MNKTAIYFILKVTLEFLSLSKKTFYMKEFKDFIFFKLIVRQEKDIKKQIKKVQITFFVVKTQMVRGFSPEFIRLMASSCGNIIIKKLQKTFYSKQKDVHRRYLKIDQHLAQHFVYHCKCLSNLPSILWDPTN